MTSEELGFDDDFQKIFSLTREKESAKVRKAQRINIFTAAIMLVLVTAVIFAIDSYRKLDKARSELAETNQSLKKTKDELQLKNEELEKSKVVIARLKDSLISQMVSSMKRAAANPSEAKSILTPLVTKSDSAKKLNQQGYELLKKKDFKGAMDAFHQSENAFNGYRDSYEVYYLLWKNRQNLDDKATQSTILQEVNSKYNSWKILTPKDLL